MSNWRELCATAALLLAIGYSVYKVFFAEEVRGRVMVVQRNAEVKRLALIKVHAVPAKEAEAWRAALAVKYRQIADGRAAFIISSREERRTITNENDSSIGRLEKLLNAAIECRDSSREFWIVDPNQPSKKNRFFNQSLLDLQSLRSASFLFSSSLV